MKIATIASVVCGVGALFLLSYGGWTLTKPHPGRLPIAQLPVEQTPTPLSSPPEATSSPFVVESPPPDSPPDQPQVLYKDHQTDELVKEYLRRRYALSQLQQQPPPPQTVQQNPSALLNYLNQTGATIDAARQASDAALSHMDPSERARFEAQKKSLEQQ